jgi:uncharacterized protein
MPTLYAQTAPTFVRQLTNLSNILDKAQHHADSTKFDSGNYLQLRLIADMLTFTRQVQVACDFAKGAMSRLAGVDVPKWEDNEASLADLKARIAKTIDYVQSFKPEQLDGPESRAISIKIGGQDKQFDAATYVSYIVMPNFYFHLTTAYAILRSNGVALGKGDFIGNV